METRCCHFSFSNYSKKKRWRYGCTAAMGKTGGGEMIVFSGLLTHAAVRGGTCAFTLKTVHTLSGTAYTTIGLRSRHRINPRPTRFVSGMAGECRWRPWRNPADPRSRGQEVARGVLHSSPKPGKSFFFLPSERGREICRLVCTQQRPNVFIADAFPVPAMYHRSFCEHCDQRVGLSSSQARPVQISWRSLWFFRSTSVEDPESRRLKRHLPEFSPVDLGPRSAQEVFFRGFWNVWHTFFEHLCS